MLLITIAFICLLFLIINRTIVRNMQNCNTKINTIETPQSNGVSSISMEEYVRLKERQEDQID